MAGSQRVAGVTVRADAQLAGRVPRDLVDLRFDPRDRLQHVVGGFDEQPPRRSQQHPPPGPDEERRAQLVLELAQLVADGRLRDVQQIGSAGHAFGASHLRDQPEVVRLEDPVHQLPLS